MTSRRSQVTSRALAIRNVFKAAIVALILALAAPVAAGPFEDGQSAYSRGNYSTAVRLWRPLADQGYARAQANLGFMYSSGRGVPQNYTQAVKWYRKAAEQGNAEAQANVGGMYRQGRGVPQDNAEAAKRFRLAAEQGYVRAQYNLGYMYADGQGVTQNSVQAHMWLNLADREGLESAAIIRDLVAGEMTSAQIAEAQKLAREWKPK